MSSVECSEDIPHVITDWGIKLGLWTIPTSDLLDGVVPSSLRQWKVTLPCGPFVDGIAVTTDFAPAKKNFAVSRFSACWLSFWCFWGAWFVAAAGSTLDDIANIWNGSGHGLDCGVGEG